MKLLKTIFKLLGVLIVLFLLDIGIVLIHGTMTDYQPEAAIPLISTQKANENIIQDSIISLVIWNVGFGGLGKESDFFYDDGRFLTPGDKMIHTEKKYVEKNIQGATQFLKNTKADFFLLQEVDFDSDRSYNINQYEAYQKSLPNYSSYFAPNYQVGRVPVPVLHFWDVYGQTNSGLGSFSRYQPTEATRFQLPGAFDWPTNIFQLDRCLLVQRFKVKNNKELVVVNIHNSAYDKGGVMKEKQMDFLKDMLIKEYEKGNYVIAGGDWNQCPPNFKFDSFRPSIDGYSQINIDVEFYPLDWQWVYDPRVPTNRKANNIYDTEKTFVTLIDFFLISPNLKAIMAKGISQGFDFSDHQPVYMEVELH
jgi:endonuclease/exonuclease/phosphatase family metal-dependent hydrolase